MNRCPKNVRRKKEDSQAGDKGKNDTSPMNAVENFLPTDQFNALYRQSIEALGTRNADTDARVIIRTLALPHDEVASVRSIFLNEPDAHVYEGVVSHFQGILKAGDAITIWTQGETTGFPEQSIDGFDAQLRKIVTSDIRRQSYEKTYLTPEEKQRFTVVSAETNKEELLESVFQRYQEQGIDHVVLVDDRANNIAKAQSEVSLLQKKGIFTGSVDFVWLAQGHHKNEQINLSDGVTTVSSFAEFASWDSHVRSSQDGTTGYIFDWDHTLADETARKEEIRQIIADRYATFDRKTSYMDECDPRHHAICDLLGILPVRALIEPLDEGASGVGVYRVNWDGISVVVKHESSQDRFWRLTQEKDGFDKLSKYDGIIRQEMPTVHKMSFDSVLGHSIVMDYVDGPNIRHAMRDQLFSDAEIVEAANQLLMIQGKFWQSQQDHLIRNHETWFSMPKTEWPETKKLLQDVYAHLEESLGLSLEEIETRDLVIRFENQEFYLPSFTQLEEYLSSVMDQRPPVVLPLGYNDLSFGNAIMTKDRHGDIVTTIIDPQWVREQSNPRSDIVRTIKSVSGTTVDDITQHISLEDQHIVFTVSAQIPELLLEIEAMGLRKLPELAEILQDKSFVEGVLDELAASQFREISLSVRRGKTDAIGFNLFNMARYFQMKQRVAA